MMPRRAQPFVRLSLLASTVLLMGYSPMTIAADTATKPAAAADTNPMLAPWTGPYEGVPP